MATTLKPMYYAVNYAHMGLREKSLEAQIRIVGAFSTIEGMRQFSTKFSEEHGLDCFLVTKGVPTLIPCNYSFLEDGGVQMQHKMDAIVHDFEERNGENRSEFNSNRDRKKSYAKDSTFDHDTELKKFQDLCKQRHDIVEKGKSMMCGEMFSIRPGVDKSFHMGIYAC